MLQLYRPELTIPMKVSASLKSFGKFYAWNHFIDVSYFYKNSFKRRKHIESIADAVNLNHSKQD